MKRMLIGLSAAGALWIMGAGSAMASSGPYYTAGAGQSGGSAGTGDRFAFRAQGSPAGATGRMFLRTTTPGTDGTPEHVTADVICLNTAGPLAKIDGIVTESNSRTAPVGYGLEFNVGDNDASQESQQPPVDSYSRAEIPPELYPGYCNVPPSISPPITRGDIFVSTAPGAPSVPPVFGGWAPDSESR